MRSHLLAFSLAAALCRGLGETVVRGKDEEDPTHVQVEKKRDMQGHEYYEVREVKLVAPSLPDALSFELMYWQCRDDSREEDIDGSEELEYLLLTWGKREGWPLPISTFKVASDWRSTGHSSRLEAAPETKSAFNLASRGSRRIPEGHSPIPGVELGRNTQNPGDSEIASRRAKPVATLEEWQG